MPADLITRLLLQNQEFDKNLKASREQVQSFEKRLGGMKASLTSFVAGFAGMAGVSFAFQDAVQKSMQFEKALSSLRSLTGVSAKELDFFKQEAIKLGAASTQSASQVVDAFKLIGSQKPELLKNKDALAEVTRQAIILAEAAEMEVPEAAKALTGSLNQMGESANKAGEYINILAAASQAGSADIPYLTKAIEKSGGAASSVGVKYNELVAIIEAIAPKITEASEAGTALRGIFLKLEASADKNLKPSVVGLSEAIKNLSAKNYDATQMTKIFGLENVTAAMAIVNAKEKYLEYADVITGTNMALEQQAINNDNLAGSLNKMGNSWEAFILSLNQSNGQLKQTADLVQAILGRMTEAIKSEEQKQQEIIAVSVKKEKSDLDRVIQSWTDYGDSKAEAISKAMNQQNRDNGGGVGYANQLRDEEKKLSELEARYEELQKNKIAFNPGKEALKTNPIISVVSNLTPLGDVLEGLPDIDVNLQTQSARVRVEEQIETQKALITELNKKNETYKQSIQYLNDELKVTNEIKDNVKNTKSEGVTDEVRKAWGKQDSKDKRELTFKESVDNTAINIRAELQKKINGDIPIPVFVKPEYVESEEQVNTKGSIEDYQQKIQAVTLAYNEATTDGLRAMYATQRDDLENHLQGMTDINQGMIDISNELNSLIQSGVVSGFESLGEAIGSGDAGEAMRSMLMGLMDMLKQFGAALVAAGIAKLAFDKLLNNPIAAIAAGGALIVATTAAKSALQKSATPMANGAIAYGPTYALVGEYAGASNNPEVVAPLNKLRDLIRPTDESNDIHITGETVLRGDAIHIVFDRYMKKQGRGR